MLHVVIQHVVLQFLRHPTLVVGGIHGSLTSSVESSKSESQCLRYFTKTTQSPESVRFSSATEGRQVGWFSFYANPAKTLACLTHRLCIMLHMHESNDVSNDPETFACHTCTCAPMAVCVHKKVSETRLTIKSLFSLAQTFKLTPNTVGGARSWILLCRDTISATPPEGSNSDTMTPPARSP